MHPRRERRRPDPLSQPRPLACWAGRCPGSNLTGGQRISGKTTPGDLGPADLLTRCVRAAAHTRDTDPSAQFRRPARRIGRKKAALAGGHTILIICQQLLTDDRDHDDLGGDHVTRRANPDRQPDRLIRQLHDLGYRVTLDRVA